MQFKTLAAALSLVSVVAATGNPAPIPASQCNTSDLHCCNSTQSSDALAPFTQTLLGLLGIGLGSLDLLVGLTCSPVTVIGLAGNSCSAQPVCCSNNNFNGVVALGCTPVNVNL